MHVGVAGLGGLGHMAVKFAKAFGVKVTVISTSPSKKKEATEHLEADSFLVSRDVDQMEISGLIFISLAFFCLAKHWSDGSHQLIFFNSRQTPLSSSKTPSPISFSSNLNKTFDINSLTNNTTQTQPLSDPTLSSIPPTSHPKPLPPPPHESFGIVDENGTMVDGFEVRDFDSGVVDNWGSDIEAEVVEDGCGGSRVVVKKFGLFMDSMREYILCLDNTEAIRHFNSTEKGEIFERHCPEEGGLGHMAVKFAKAFGVKVTVISTSPSKEKEAVEHLEANSFLVSCDIDQMEAAIGTIDGIIDTVSAIHHLLPLLNLLKSHGKLIMVGAPEKPLELPVFPLLMGRKTIAGSAAGDLKETKGMIDFAAKHNITSGIEVIPMDYVNTTLERLLKGDVRYRFVINIVSQPKPAPIGLASLSASNPWITKGLVTEYHIVRGHGSKYTKYTSSNEL
ncbi:hypothetical protein HYC85_001491 [Camellia sinensis]|uniref:Alcohol dehydrogenase-like C-terminal domain-containing protein n=1 Tax=Camellia sinensis TaxID=4442 RepID=A0A7J7I5I5_CAMSI|nr:hypothetical protein HYC85_001491 [Camellia sinensis]